jgi:hypothetical protein
MNLKRVCLLLVVSLTATWACKYRGKDSAAKSLTEPRARSVVLMPLLENIAFIAPVDESSRTNCLFNADDFIQRAQGRLETGFLRTRAKVKAHKVIALEGGECLWMVQEFQGKSFSWVPVMSVKGDEVFEWLTSSEVTLENGNYTLKSSNIAFKHPLASHDDPTLTDAQYWIYQNNQHEPVVINFADHVHLERMTYRKFWNDLYDTQMKRQLWFEQVRNNVWVIKGKVANGIVCDGSVMWKDDTGDFKSITQVNDQKIVASWGTKDETGVLKHLMFMDGVKVPSEVTQNLSKCNDGFSRLSELVSKTAYIADYGEPLSEADLKKVKEFNPNEKFSLGQKIRTTDGVLWIVLESVPAIGHFIVLNASKTFFGDEGVRGQHVFQWDLTDSSFKEIGTLGAYLNYSIFRIGTLNDKRFAAQTTNAQAMEAAIDLLNQAEKRANFIGAGYEESHKFLLNIGAAMVASLSYTKFAEGSKLFGIPIATNLATTITRSPLLMDRIKAAFLVTGIQSIAMFTVCAPTIADKTLLGYLNFAGGSTGSTLLANGFRSFFPARSAAGVVMNTASGVMFRWRKMQNESAIGIVNKNQFLNLVAGGVTSLAAMSVTGYGQSATNLVMGAGWVASEVISGRGQAGALIGTAVEIGVEIAQSILKVNPIYYAIASTAGRSVSAMIQLEFARRNAEKVGAQLDQTLAMREEQVAKVNALLYLGKTQPDFYNSLLPVEQGLIVGAILDPFKQLRQRYQ